MSTAQAHPTVGESAIRLWNRLPSLWKALIPALGGLLIVLLPASLLISSRIYAVTTGNLRAQHQALLAEAGSAFDELFSRSSGYLSNLANADSVKNCAATGCVAEAQTIFGAELAAAPRDTSASYIEIGFINLEGKQTARALRGSGGVPTVPGAGPLFQADPAPLRALEPNQVYVFPVARDTRLAASEAYQQPALRLAVPVFAAGVGQGSVTAVLNLDDFFVQTFPILDQMTLLLLDTEGCLVASSDETQRQGLYKTWSGDGARPCYRDLRLPDWDVTVQSYRDTVLSTHVLHGALSTSGQTWTIVVQQITALAYAQASALQALLWAAHLITIVFVGSLIVAADRAAQRFAHVDRVRLAKHARDTRFNPYIIGVPVEDPHDFFGRTEALAEVIGLGVMGGDDVLIQGDRRIGKTSMLRQVERRLKERRVFDPTYWYWLVFLSLQGVPASQFYSTLMGQILRDLGGGETLVDLRFHKRPPLYGVADFHEDVNEVLRLPHSAPDANGRQARLVLCLDNLHVWFEGGEPAAPAFHEAFRKMLGDVGGQLKLIATATRLPAEVLDPTMSVITLGPLELDEAERLLRQPVEQYFTFTDQAVAHILKGSDCLPMELQRLARHAVQIMLEQDAAAITQAHAERALSQAVTDWEPAFRLHWNGGIDKAGATVVSLSADARAALGNFAREDRPIPPAWYTEPAPLLTRASLDDLAFTDRVGSLRLTSVFKTWLERTLQVER
jgi:hypothetical protein